MINSEVITETGKCLGWIRKVKFNSEPGQISSFVIATLAIPWIPDQLLSTYELSFNEIVSRSPRRIIVFDGAEDRLNQLTEKTGEFEGVGRKPLDSSMG